LVRNYFQKSGAALPGVISLGIILAFMPGFVISANNTIRNRYIHYGLFNLALFDLVHYINIYFPIFLLIFLALILAFFMLRFFIERNSKYPKADRYADKIIYSFLFSAVVILLLAYTSLVFYRDIVASLKGNPVTARLGSMSTSPRETYEIFLLFMVIAGILCSVCLTYAVSKTGISEPFQRTFQRIIKSKKTTAAGVCIIAALLVTNIFIPLYRNLNRPAGPNVILITIDTLRADHLGSYGYGRNTSPEIDKLAREGILFENAYSQAPWTYPSVSSIHTSLYPSQIGQFSSVLVLNESLLTLAEYMKNNFYETIAVVSNTYVSKGWGFSQGFDTFNQEYLSNPGDVTSRLVTDKAVGYLKKYGDKPFFLWIHYMDPHAIYIHHPEYGYRDEKLNEIQGDLIESNLNKIKETLSPSAIQYVIDTYDEEISFMDDNVGRLIDSIKELGLDKNTVIILTADHGEEFKERAGFGHASSLYNELIHVPLIIYDPSEKTSGGKRVIKNVEVRNIAKTITDSCRLEDSPFGGKSLIRIAEDGSSDETIYSQQSDASGNSLHKKAAIAGNWKLIENMDRGTFELYSLGKDPREKTNQFSSDKIETEKVRKMLLSALSGFNPERVADSKNANLNNEDIKRLKALGYVQ
jgi:arylsulfatase A-like enzyme